MRIWRVSAAILSTIAVVSTVRAASYTFTEVAIPGMTNVRPLAISATGRITGTFTDPGTGATGGFVKTGDAIAIIPPIVPGAWMQPVAINASGQVVGGASYTSDGGAFLYHDGVLTPLVFPGAAVTYIAAINDAGEIAGSYVLNSPTMFVGHAFAYSKGVYKSFEVPGGSATTPTGINASGQIVGRANVGGQSVGFVYDHGVFTVRQVDGLKAAYPNAVNDKLQIVGGGSLTCTDPAPPSCAHGGLVGFYYFDGFSILDTGATYSQLSGINNVPQAVGAQTDASGNTHGIVVDATGLTWIAVPGALATLPLAINDSGAIVGVVEEPNTAYYGFLATPAP